MAEGGGDDSQEKTEDPTPRRLEKAREEGQVPQSKDLGTALVLMAGATGLLLFGGSIGGELKQMLEFNFALERGQIFDTSQMLQHLGQSATTAAVALTPLLIALAVAAFLGPIMLSGFLLSGKAVAPQLSRMSPVKGLGRMFGIRSLVELGKSVAKVSLVCLIAMAILDIRTEDLLAISSESPNRATEHTLWTLAWSFFLLSCSTIIIAVIDVPFQIHDHQKKMRMSKQEVKDEFKETEGKPEVKQKVRQLQQEMTQRRMMEDVPSADVVITNPEHYAVALKYDGKSMAAPVVVAKGADEIATKIMEIAREHRVDVLRTPPLARAVYHNAEIGENIPEGLYMAVAQVLAYLFQLRQYRRNGGKKPVMPALPIPDDLKRDE
ncbi:flagellar biosynthesis protein FlhB [uncultured Halovibrio sp.]|uniref:flagellar biosynthesis protein FlhB n=1 Tax=uncultured Halovibrio sp. TaxID=985049 RepID=UPI0025D93A1E|nr:flagellar biosynthesis protein FlhB [uncultured Halovibrio sp.]